MIGVIADKEFNECCRDGRFRIAALLMLVLLVTASLLGWGNYAELLTQAEAAAEHDYQRFGQQDPKHPHDAAHYGVYSFKTPRPLTIVDGGIQPYIGAAIMNGAHVQGEVEFPPAQDMSALQRFGDLSPVAAVQSLLPLLVILLSFGAFAAEREQGTLRQLLSLGVRPTALLWGKALGICKALAGILLPVALLGVIAAGWLASADSRSDEIVRALLLILLYGLYLSIMLWLSLGASACCRSARNALAIMLVFWGLTVFAIPRVLLDVGGRVYPTPSNVEFWQSFMSDLTQAWQNTEQTLQKKLLSEYHVERLEDLPFDYTGQSMQVGDEAAEAVSERYSRQRYDSYNRQNQLLQWGTIIAPSSAVTLLSMALTGNDLAQHQDFTNQVEDYRRHLNKRLNDYVDQHQTKGDHGWDSSLIKADKGFFQSIPAFQYHYPSWHQALGSYHWALGLLMGWAVAAFGFARFAVSRLSGI